jgi:hypothetical protein
MSELIEVIAQTSQNIHQLAELAEDGVAGPLLADLELQLATIASEAAHLKQENIELHRQLMSQPKIDSPLVMQEYRRPTPPKKDVRQTMQMVSQFYQRASREKPFKLAA